MIRLTYGLKAILLLSVLLCLVGCSALDLDHRKPEKVDFSGHWELNLPLSAGVIENPRSRNDVFDTDINPDGISDEISDLDEDILGHRQGLINYLNGENNQMLPIGIPENHTKVKMKITMKRMVPSIFFWTLFWILGLSQKYCFFQ